MDCGLAARGYHGAVIFERMQLWIDPVKRSGPEAMAVDEWLLETVSCPVLRVYEWAGDWASIGYFGRFAEARELFPGLNLVRRWTGGGMVDHRADWTYTVVIPQGERLASLRGAESYRVIHEKLVATIEVEGIGCELSSGDSATGATRCFENPVGFDLVGPDGGKLAGAGQRRSKSGLLHQGSLAIPCEDGSVSRRRAEEFARRLAGRWEDFGCQPDPADLAGRVGARYASLSWMSRR